MLLGAWVKVCLCKNLWSGVGLQEEGTGCMTLSECRTQSECRTVRYDSMTLYDTSHRSDDREVVYDSCRTLSECRSCRSVGAVGVSELCRSYVGVYVGSVGPGLKLWRCDKLNASAVRSSGVRYSKHQS